MVKAGVPEGEAIATANKTGNRMQRKGRHTANERRKAMYRE